MTTTTTAADPFAAIEVRTAYVNRNGARIAVTGPHPGTGRTTLRTMPYDYGARDPHQAAVVAWAAGVGLNVSNPDVHAAGTNDAGTRRVYSIRVR